MPLKTYEDFFELSVKQLTDFLTVRGLSTSGQKVELDPRAFTAMELNIDIIKCTDEQQKKLTADYKKTLQNITMPDPNSVSADDRTDYITKWQQITMENVFSYILP